MGEARRRKLAGESEPRSDSRGAKKASRKKRLRDYKSIPNMLVTLGRIAGFISRRNR